jgi:hypothetical protein
MNEIDADNGGRFQEGTTYGECRRTQSQNQSVYV